MGQPLSFIFEFTTVNRNSAHSILLSNVSSLKHKLRNYSMHDIVEIVKMRAFLSSAKTSEILYSSRNKLLE